MKTMRSLVTVLLVLSLLTAVFMVGVSADSKDYKDTAGNVIISLSSATDAIGDAELVATDVSGVYPGITLDDDTYRKVWLAYDVKLVNSGAQGDVPKDISAEKFGVKILIPEDLAAKASADKPLEVYAINIDGEGTKIESSVKDGYIEFEVTGIATVAVAIKDAAPVPYVEPDLTWLVILIIVLVVLGIGVGVFFLIRHFRKKNAPAADVTAQPAPVEEPAEVAVEEPEAVEEPIAVAIEEPEVVEEPIAVAVEEPEVVEAPVAVAVEEPEVVEEPVAVAVEEPAAPVLEPAPIPELKPIINLNFVEEKDGVLPAEATEAVSVRFRTSFESRYIQSGVLQDYYTAIKNALLSYKGVKSRLSWNYDAFNKGRVQCAKINIKGNALLVYLALDPANYNAKKYHFNDMSSKPKFKDVPMLMKVKSERALKYTLELIEEMMKALEIPAGKPANLDYHRPYQTTEELATLGLVKVILPAGMTLEDNASVIKTNVGAMLSTENEEA